MKPTIHLCTWVDSKGRETWRQYHDETDSESGELPAEWDDPPTIVTALYTEKQLREIAESMRERCAKACESSDRYRGDYFAAKCRALGDGQ